ncbi:DUF6285 domain-containing protein [Nocardioides sp. MH1]|uniref:DUF6285 domain-containing protein n=1 Tax=Nocardioides sp. MH1 TaxID=3242490 RepID=UPI0035227D0B
MSAAGGSAPHDRPDPVELLVSVREHLAAVPDPDRDPLHRRVAANVVAMVERELAAAPADEVAHAERLALLGVADNRELAELAATMGESDPRYPDLRRELRAWAEAKLAVVNPRYLEAP